MGNIQVKPEELRRIAKNFKYASNVESNRHLNIQRELFNLQMKWIGASSLSFYNDLPRMNKAHESFLNILKQIEDELMRIAEKFEKADMEYSSKNSKNDSLLMNSKSVVETGAGVLVKGIGNVINGEKYEKSFVDEKGTGGLFIKGLTVEAEPFVSSRTYDKFDMKDKNKREQTFGPMVGFTVAQAGIELENIKGSNVGAEAKVALATAELGAHVENGNLHIGAEATLVKYESAIKIPLPFSDKKLQIGGSASLGTVGGSLEAGKGGLKFHVPVGPGVGLWGFGGEFAIKE
ncbi:type VII secretion protein [Bacillus wiedmannii]|uniref:WXG100 family type VII secretion target n=1 Tax=Bacillus wiedmannii TaxID=1890302 RepID=UPI000BF23FC1|nr:WXG100 family type VII secretion target [Bacillus wiedmannii]PEK03764.1 type VII secretion protein [Bacillus wiedmannii]PEL83678.1 type VII secretion protein [Bacillus wiedmannii]PEM28544.1 type VII secretion protein [Bacillus wiedmannii]PEM84567.1 type VII secretion protein [Bacillus wiedmannii]PEO84930.1 type VII secretion protein [Bacillus wiedmannii]